MTKPTVEEMKARAGVLKMAHAEAQRILDARGAKVNKRIPKHLQSTTQRER